MCFELCYFVVLSCSFTDDFFFEVGFLSSATFIAEIVTCTYSSIDIIFICYGSY